MYAISRGFEQMKWQDVKTLKVGDLLTGRRPFTLVDARKGIPHVEIDRHAVFLVIDIIDYFQIVVLHGETKHHIYEHTYYLLER